MAPRAKHDKLIKECEETIDAKDPNKLRILIQVLDDINMTGVMI